jgi:thioredoxin-related protein
MAPSVTTPVLALLAVLLTTAVMAADWSQVNRDRFNDDAVAVDVEHPAWFKHSFLDLRDDLAEARQAGKTGIVLYLSTRRCSYCRAFVDFTFAEPDIRQAMQRHFDVIGLEIISNSEIIDAQGKTWTVKDYVAHEKAYVTPTLIFIRHDGQRMLRIVGYYPPEKFRAVLAYLIEGHYQREPLGAFLSRREGADTSRAGAMMHDPELFGAPPFNLDRRAAPAGRPLLVLLERSGCADCAEFHGTVLKEPAVRALIRQYEAVQIDMTDAKTTLVTPSGERLTAREWAEKLGVVYAPALVFFDERGKEVFRLDSELKRERTEGSLQLVLEKGYRDEPQLQRWRNMKRGSGQPERRQ